MAVNTDRKKGKKCEVCDGEGYLKLPFTSSTETCPECDGEGKMENMDDECKGVNSH